ncbi:MAG: DMT family transporter [Acetobacter aceti]|uniref:EamA domain-containing protein n=1 Tax=Acetobacter aceti TaxID=435 RepID=A0A1U9KCW4_ACEAC|nr:DMT family transporter [Acetobacter aceti]AQS83653.1 hypothetical protein A0U92_01465 [Acetobacter aceti]
MRSPLLSRQTQTELLPPGAVVLAMVSITTGVSFAKTLFPLIGPAATTVLRLGLASIILAVIMRIWRVRAPLRALPAVLPYGMSLGIMNMLFYMAIARIPLGIALAVEFMGPLVLAVSFSRNKSDFLWTGLAVIGLFLLLPLRHDPHPIDPTGMCFALGAGLCWAIYILTGKKAGAAVGSYAPSLGMIAGTLTILPFGITHLGQQLLHPHIISDALALAALSSALPYSLEMYALRRLPTKTFSVLTSGEPAVGALMGMLLLGEHLPLPDWLGIAAIVTASLGTTLMNRGKTI